MPVINGQPVSAEITNPAFLDAQQDDQAAGKIDFVNTDPASGPSVFNIQENVNDLIQDNKVFVRTASHTPVGFNASFEFTFTENLFIVFKDTGITNQIDVSQSPIFLNDGESVYVTLNRDAGVTLVPSINTVIPKSRETFRIATRAGNGLVLCDNTTILSGNSAIIGGSGSSGGTQIKVDLFDPVSTTLPTTDPTILDGVTIISGMRVLFTNLSSGNNQIYEATVFGGMISWVAQNVFSGSFTPSDGDAVRIKSGTGFQDQLAEFNGTQFTVNDVVRYFSGTDYWEQSSLKTSTLTDNTTGTVFQVAFAGSENIFVDYSVTRNTDKQAGILMMITDGTNVSITDTGAVISLCGVTFNADISGSNIRLRYTTTSTGFNATMKYSIRRWSDSAGGPGGPPTYSPGSSPVGAAGITGNIQFNNAGLLAATTNLNWDNSNQIFKMGGIEFTGLQTITLVNNVSSPALAFMYSGASFPFAVVEYSIVRDTAYEVGRLLVVTDGMVASASTDSHSINLSGISFSASYSGGSVSVLYTSTNTGFNGTLKYSIRRWS